MFDRNSVFYFCSMVEYVGRITKNHRSYIIKQMKEDNIKHELEVASVNHSLPFEQVSDEWIEKYNIKEGSYDSINDCNYSIPSYTSIGKVYTNLIFDIYEENDLVPTIQKVFNSFIIDEITDFNSSVYYSNPDYIKQSYLAGKILD